MNDPKYELELTSAFRKDYKKARKRGLNLTLLNDVVTKLQNGEQLPASCADHPLKGNWVNHRECHIQPDRLLIYRIVQDTLVQSLGKNGNSR